MRVLAISEDRNLLEELRRLLADVPLASETITHQGTLHGLTALPVEGEVDVLLIDCRREETATLADIERFAAYYPRLNTVLVVERETPELLLRALRLGVREVLKTPLSSVELQSSFQHLLQRGLQGVASTKGEVHAFLSCKGGSGASFLATNLGYTLAHRSGKQVVLLDLNLHFGDAVLYVSDQHPSITLPDVAHDVQRLDKALLRSALVEVLPNYGILAAADDPARASEIRPAHVEALIRFVRSHYDFILLDLGRSLDTCSIQALDLADHIYPVMQLALPFLRDAKRLFEVFRSLGYGREKIRPILNRTERSSTGLMREDAERIIGQPFFATIPNHYKSVTASVNQGIPIEKLDAASPVSTALADLAGRLAHLEKPVSRGFLGRLFRHS